MGCGASILHGSKPEEENDVDRMMREAQEEAKNHHKMLLLGAGESGKSTVVKQVKLLYQSKGLSPEELSEFRHAIQRNAVETCQTMLRAMDDRAVGLADEARAEDRDTILALDDNASYSLEQAAAITRLWADGGVQDIFARRAEYWLLDATPYYMEHAERFAEDDFVPTEEDMIMARVRTTGIQVTDIKDPPDTFHVVDVGGQRSERRKWIQCFDDVKCIIFLCGLSGYHQVLFEDTSANRMHESLSIFDDVTKKDMFRDTMIVLFLNKKDLFESMIREHSLKECFPDYDGPDGEALPALEFIQAKFREVLEQNCPGKALMIHVVAARVRMDMKVAFGEVKDTVKRLKDKKSKRR